MTLHSKKAIVAAGMLVCGSGAHAASLEAYPARPIRLIVPQAAGSSSDTVARFVATEATRVMGQQIVVDNRPGGALMIGLELTARATPDGYTIGYGPVGGLAISPNMQRKPPIDVRTDLQPVIQATTGQMLLAVSPTTPFKSVRDVIDYAKQHPGKLSNASSGNGTPGHVGFELFKTMTATNIVHVPYKGGASGITDLISGQVQLMMESINSITPHAKAGRVRGVAVTGPKRSPALPDIPTVSEAGVAGYEATTWTGIVAPAGVPRAIVLRLNAALNQAVMSDTMKERLTLIGAEPAGGTPEQFGALIRSEYAKWGEVVKRTAAKID